MSRFLCHLGRQQIISRLARRGPSPWFFQGNTSLQPASKVKNPVSKSRSASKTEPENETIALVSRQPAPPVRVERSARNDRTAKFPTTKKICPAPESGMPPKL